jgi:hypothetical protein
MFRLRKRGSARTAVVSPPARPASPATPSQRKSPSPFGPGLCGVGGRGEGDADHRGGVRAERRPRLRVPEKIRARMKVVPINEAPRNAYRGASPTAAIKGDYLPSPIPLLPQKSDSEKPPSAPVRLRRAPAAAAAGGDSINHILALDSGFRPRQSGRRGRKSRGESSTRPALGWGDSIEIAEGGSAGTSGASSFCPIHRKCLRLTARAIENRGGM